MEFFELYRPIMHRITNNLTPRRRKVIGEVIHAIVASSRHLEFGELQALVEETLDDRLFDLLRLLKSECGAFIRLVEDTNNPEQKYVEVAHQTFRDFITSDASLHEEFHISLPDSHGRIASTLLRYLSKHDFRSRLISGKFTTLAEDDEARIQKEFPLLNYAASQWSSHLRRSSMTLEWTENLSIAVTQFLKEGPLLLWIEALAVFRQLPALSRTRVDVLDWTNANAHSTSSLSDFDLNLILNWARDIARLCTESSDTLSESPNCVHDLLFDLFPQPSLFYERYNNGLASISGGALAPSLVGVSQVYKVGYDVAAISHGYRKLLAIANHEHIRILETFGGSVSVISPKGGTKNLGSSMPSSSRHWAVLAMAFNNGKKGEKNLFAVVQVSLGEDSTPYCPELLVWDVDKDELVTSSHLELEEGSSKLCLVDQVQFSMGGENITCGAWTYNLSKNQVTLDPEDTISIFGKSEAAVLSPDRRYALRLDTSDQRTLVRIPFGRTVRFNKPIYHEYGTDYPTTLPSERLFLQQRTRPFRWWELRCEVSSSYRFSLDSRWFARFTDTCDVVLHDLGHDTVQVIYHPHSSWSQLLLNNITFDIDSKRMAWIFMFLDERKSWETRIQLWSLVNNTSLGELVLGRYGWRDYIEFCSDPKHILSYRSSIAMWDIEMGITLDKACKGIEAESINWIVRGFPITQYSIRLQYSSDGDTVYLTFPEDNGLQILQAIQKRHGTFWEIIFRKHPSPRSSGASLEVPQHNQWWSFNVCRQGRGHPQHQPACCI